MNKLLSVIVIAAFFSCADVKATSESATANQQLINQYFDFFNKHQWKQMAEMYASIAAFKDPSLCTGVVQQTTQQIIDKYKEMGTLFPDIHDKVLQVYRSGENNVIVEFVSTGTGPDQSKFTLPVCTIFTIENGKITKDFTYYDNFDNGID